MPEHAGSIGWTVLHTCTDGQVHDSLVLTHLRAGGRQWLRCYRCGNMVRLIVQTADGKVVDRFDNGVLPEWASPAPSGPKRVSSDS